MRGLLVRLPTTARRRFAEEDAAGIPRRAATRNYRDPLHQPELIDALSETFDALCGFRAVDASRRRSAGERVVGRGAGEFQTPVAVKSPRNKPVTRMFAIRACYLLT